jgi:hypothetical protein
VPSSSTTTLLFASNHVVLVVVSGSDKARAVGRDPVTASTDHGTGISLKREKIVGAEEIAGIS